MAGHTITVDPLTEEENSRFMQLYDSFEKYGQRFIRAKPSNCILPAAYEKYKDIIKGFTLKADDICLLTYPKCGTVWTQELLTLVKNDFDFEKTKALPLKERGVMLDFSFIVDVLKKDGIPVESLFQTMLEASSPRLVLSHLAFSLLPNDLFDKCKVLICLRNPKDVIVSSYHFQKIMRMYGFTGDFEEFFDVFMKDMSINGSYFEYMKESWAERHRENVCLLFYEDMKKNLAANVRKVAKFLGKDFTEEQIQKSVEFLSFEEMKERGAADGMQLLKKQESDGHFMRKGEAGDWKGNLTEKMLERIDEAIAKHLTPVGLEFRYE